MFIELTDHLRCPEEHEEQYLVLIPDRIVDRSVHTGRLGCPVCRREYPVRSGVADFGPPGPPIVPGDPAQVDVSALHAFLGLAGPGGYVGLVGWPSLLAAGLMLPMPGVHFVAINPPAEVAELPMLSLVRAPRIPLRSRTLRGIVLGGGFGSEGRWPDEALRVVLPGLRVVGEGEAPSLRGLQVLGSGGGWWVAKRIG